ncbi:MAG TPA: translation initiation factor [Chthoniobacteraceae bacterium]|jgi:translation initiation factor 1|nr:translation initiation factor [Chthoniobacteraceae bacterium]
MKGKPRIELNPAQGGLHAAFAGLSIPGLPEGPPASEPPPAAAPAKRGRVILRRETAHRGGKAVLIVQDFAAHLGAEEIAALAKRLRAACGCGGTLREREIELQGEHVAKVRALLESEGYQVAGVK